MVFELSLEDWVEGKKGKSFLGRGNGMFIV